LRALTYLKTFNFDNETLGKQIMRSSKLIVQILRNSYYISYQSVIRTRLHEYIVAKGELVNQQKSLQL